MAYKDPKSEATINKRRRDSRKYYAGNVKRQLIRNQLKKDQIRDYIHLYKEFRGCMDCGNKFPYYVLDLDHRDPSIKEVTPSRLWKSNSWTKVNAELEKCDVVCANCHRVRTHEKNHYMHRN